MYIPESALVNSRNTVERGDNHYIVVGGTADRHGLAAECIECGRGEAVVRGNGGGETGRGGENRLFGGYWRFRGLRAHKIDRLWHNFNGEFSKNTKFFSIISLLNQQFTFIIKRHANERVVELARCAQAHVQLVYASLVDKLCLLLTAKRVFFQRRSFDNKLVRVAALKVI
jgi:hypothetical protein